MTNINWSSSFSFLLYSKSYITQAKQVDINMQSSLLKKKHFLYLQLGNIFNTKL